MLPSSRPTRLLFAAVFFVLCNLPAGVQGEPLRWKEQVAAIAERSPREPGGVVFIGSSSIGMWKTLVADFPRLRVLNHGFGGSNLEDSVHFFAQLVQPFAPAAVVLYAGENDLAAGMPPEKVAADFREFQRRLRATLPEARLIYVSLKPSPSRVKLLAAMVQTNALIAAECARDPLARFVDVFTLMLDAHGQPRAELFLPDRLHMNATGYALWAAQLDPVLASAP